MTHSTVARFAARATLAAVLTAAVSAAGVASGVGSSANGHDRQTVTEAGKDVTVSPMKKEY